MTMMKFYEIEIKQAWL